MPSVPGLIFENLALPAGSVRPYLFFIAVTLKQFEAMQDRVRGAKPVASSVFSSQPAPRLSDQIILGVDPSLRATGFGVIRAGKPRPQMLAHGTIVNKASYGQSQCLLRILETLRDVIRQTRPTVCVVEAVFYAQNLQTAMIMGAARGVALAVAAEAGLDIYEIAARKMKLAVVGYGAAQKLAVIKMVQRMLALTEAPTSDAADALALALAHHQEQSRYGLANPRKI